MSLAKDDIRTLARDLGFEQCRFAAAGPPAHGGVFADWVTDGNAAAMDYLARGEAKRLDPQLVLPTVRTVISLSSRYPSPPPEITDWRETLRGRIASYALGRDYHDVLKKRLKVLVRAIVAAYPDADVRPYVDTGPILERDWAEVAGVGWFGKNTNILDKQHGSYFFLAELLTSLEWQPDPPVGEHCGTCTACLTGCPTGALSPGYALDARKCISYWTIEHRGVIPAAMRSQLGNWVFGCDVCQEVCPWNEKHRPRETVVEWLTPSLPELLALDEHAFRERFRGTAVRRTKREGLARNAAIALGNSGNQEAVSTLVTALQDDPSEVVRLHAAWALGTLGGPAAQSALERAKRSEEGLPVAAEAERALERQR